MSLLLTILTMPLMALAQSAPTPAPQAAEKCRTAQVRGADNPMPARRLEPLGRQPLADQEKAVMYREGGCLKPVIVREDVGTEQR